MLRCGPLRLAMIMVMLMTPVPVLLLLVVIQFPVVMVRVMMSLYRPPLIVNSLVVIPCVIVVVIRVIRTIVVMFGATRENCHAKSNNQDHGLDFLFSAQRLLPDTNNVLVAVEIFRVAYEKPSCV